MRLFIGGMSAATKANDLRAHFTAIGNVGDAVIIMDKDTGRSKGFGFVEVETELTLDEVVGQMNGTKIEGSERKITVGEAHKRTERQPNHNGGGNGNSNGNVRRFAKSNSHG